MKMSSKCFWFFYFLDRLEVEQKLEWLFSSDAARDSSETSFARGDDDDDIEDDDGDVSVDPGVGEPLARSSFCRSMVLSCEHEPHTLHEISIGFKRA